MTHAQIGRLAHCGNCRNIAVTLIDLLTQFSKRVMAFSWKAISLKTPSRKGLMSVMAKLRQLS